MLAAPIPDNEAARLASLQKMLLLVTPDEESFDRITRTAQRLFKVPIALVSLIDANRQWFKSCIGLPARETDRDVSFCGHAILSDDIFVIEDATADPRFADNPLVTGEPRVIFYAGCPLQNAEGYRVGTLCIIDHAPREFSQADRQALADLGRWVEQVFSLRDLGESQQEMVSELSVALRGSLLDAHLNIWKQSAILDLLQREVTRSYRHHRRLSLMMVRIEEMTTTVDEHGAGFQALALLNLVRNLRSVTKSYDMCGRYGDDAILLILPEKTKENAMTIFDALRQTTAMVPCLIGDALIDVDIRAGISSADFSQETPNPQEMLAATLCELAGSAERQAILTAARVTE